MSTGPESLSGLSPEDKRALLKSLLEQSKQTADAPAKSGYVFPPEYTLLKQQLESVGDDGAADLFFQSFDGTNRDVASLAGQTVINFCSYNYLGMSGDPIVNKAAVEAIETYGTAVSASRFVSGERPIHRALEAEFADWMGTEEALMFVGGFSTNEDTIGHLFGQGDLVIYDSLIHASVQQGAQLSGATVVPFPHNNVDALDNLLQRQRRNAKQALIVVEGVYSMDGDIPDLPRLIEIKKRHNALLMVDEAHSIGVLGPTGRGIGEHYGIDVTEVDLWMGTLSKTFASCGGYLTGSKSLISYLRHTAPGFVYSVGLSPPNTAAALAALRQLRKEPERVATLQARSALFHTLAKSHGLDMGSSQATAAIPIIVGETKRAIALSRALLDRGILASPIGYPAVPENAARLRFFVSCTHSEEQIRTSIEAISQCLEGL